MLFEGVSLINSAAIAIPKADYRWLSPTQHAKHSLHNGTANCDLQSTHPPNHIVNGCSKENETETLKYHRRNS